MRTFKTALSVMIGLYLSHLLRLDAPVFVAIAAIAAMQPSYSETYSQIRLRVLTGVIGVVMGYLSSLITQDPLIRPLVAGLGIMITTYILLRLKLKRMVRLTLIIFMASYYAKSNKLLYGVNRVLGTLLGLFISLAINFLVASPDIESNLNESLDATYEDLMDMTQSILLLQDPPALTKLEKEINEVHHYYDLLVQEVKQPLFRDQSIRHIEDLLAAYEQVFFYLRLSNFMREDYPSLSLNNRRLIEELFYTTIIYPGNMDGGKNIVYNHYIHNLLLGLKKIQVLQRGGKNHV